MTTKILLIVLLLLSVTAFSQNSYELFRNFIYNSTPYGLNIKTTEKKEKITSFKVQICKAADECAESIEITNNFDQETFIVALESTMKNSKLVGDSFKSNPEVKLQWKNIYSDLMKDFNKKEVLTELYDLQGIEYGGKIKMNKEPIQLKVEEMYNYSKGDTIDRTPNDPKNLSFIPKYASLRLFNNKVNSISVVGDIMDGDSIVKKEATLLNDKYSIPFRSTITDRNNYSAKIYTNIDDVNYFIKCNDLLDYKPFENNYTYSLKNKEYEIRADE